MTDSRCLGCNKNTKLIESHIIPKSWRNRLNPPKDINPKMVNKPKYILDENNRPKKKKENFDIAGLPIDSNILCKSCDNILGKYDKALYGVWQYWIETRHKHKHNDIITIPFDSDLIIKGIAAIFWRASVSKKIEFRDINLGTKNNLFDKMLFQDSDFFGSITLYLSATPIKTNDGNIIEDASLAMSRGIDALKYNKCNTYYRIILPCIHIDILTDNPNNENLTLPLIWSVNKSKIVDKVVNFSGSGREKITNQHISKINIHE